MLRHAQQLGAYSGSPNAGSPRRKAPYAVAALRSLGGAAKPQAQRAMLSCDVGHVHGEKRQKKGTPVTIQEGMAAPDFELPDADGKTVKLSALRGTPVVVYFYPKDDTSGCTAEAKDFTCIADDFRKAGAEVLTANDMSCLMHLEGLIRRDRQPLRVMHVAEILNGQPI